MMGLWIALVWLIWVSVSPALAELYRWTEQGWENPPYGQSCHHSTSLSRPGACLWV